MSNFFSIDGPLYRISTVIYNLMVLNFLWVVFSLPVFTSGAATTALFYVVGKLIRKENTYLFRDFWKSFKTNFKQATIIWSILAISLVVVVTNIKSINLFGSLAIYLRPVQYVILIELVAILLYIFPLLSRYHVTTINAFKASFFMANRYIINTILAMAVIPGIFLLIYWKGLFLIFAASLYSFWVYFIIQSVLEKTKEKSQENMAAQENKKSDLDKG